jgi:hypothetical protein
MGYWKFDTYGIAVPWIQGVPYSMFSSSLLQGISNNQASVTSDILPGEGGREMPLEEMGADSSGSSGKSDSFAQNVKADTIQKKLMSKSSMAN